MLEVITPADTFDLCTVEAVNAELGIEGDTASDPIIAGYISAASDSIARYCKRVLAAQEYLETFRLDRYKNELLLSQYPVAEIASVVENDETLADEAAELNADTGSLARLVNDGPAWWPLGKIAVTYTAGFGDDISLPPAIERAAILLSCNFHNRAHRDPSIRSTQHGDTSVTYGLAALGNGDGLPPEIVALLQPYRDYRVR
jgi:uncharacterized phiE125 gp8 family phage protein